MLVLDDLGVLKRANLLEDLIDAALLSLKVEILHVNHLAQFPSLLLFLLDLLDLLHDVCLVDHPQGRQLKIDEVVFELVALEVLHHVVCELWALELSNSDGPVGCDHELLNHAVEL